MNKEGYKISNSQAGHLVHEIRREHEVDRDKQSEDDDAEEEER